MASAADLSVVIISRVGGEALVRCIERFPPIGVEMVVVLKDATIDPALWARRYPRIRFLPGSADPIPLRRRRGLDACSGAIVGMIEDTSWPERGWCDAVVAAFADAAAGAAAGPVVVASFLADRCRARAWIEYGAFAIGAKNAAVANRVPGNAMAFRRSALLSALSAAGADAGIDEDAICRSMRDHGQKILRIEGMAVAYSACPADSAYLAASARRSALTADQRSSRLRAFANATRETFACTARDIRRVRRGDRKTMTIPLAIWFALLESAIAFDALRRATAGGGKTSQGDR